MLSNGVCAARDNFLGSDLRESGCEAMILGRGWIGNGDEIQNRHRIDWMIAE